MNKPLDEYKVGDEVIVLTWDAACETNEYKGVEGVVADTGTYVERHINGTKTYPKVKVKYLRTYWDSGTTYEKETEEWVYYDTQIKLK